MNADANAGTGSTKARTKSGAARKAPAVKKTPAVKKSSGVRKAPAVKKTPAVKKAPAKKAPALKKTPTRRDIPGREPDSATDGQTSDAGSWDAPGIEDDLWSGDWDDLGAFDDAPTGDRESRREPTHQWANESIELFQNAALELIAAARTALDTAEDLVTDPQAVGVALESLRDLAGEFVRSARPGARDRSTAFDDDDFQTIRVEE